MDVYLFQPQQHAKLMNVYVLHVVVINYYVVTQTCATTRVVEVQDGGLVLQSPCNSAFPHFFPR